MAGLRKIVVNSVSGLSRDIAPLVRNWIEEGVKFVGVAGKDAADLEELIDWECIGDGESSYFMLTAAFDPSESVADAVEFSEGLSPDHGDFTDVVEF